MVPVLGQCCDFHDPDTNTCTNKCCRKNQTCLCGNCLETPSPEVAAACTPSLACPISLNDRTKAWWDKRVFLHMTALSESFDHYYIQTKINVSAADINLVRLFSLRTFESFLPLCPRSTSDSHLLVGDYGYVCADPCLGAIVVNFKGSQFLDSSGSSPVFCPPSLILFRGLDGQFQYFD